MAPLRDAVRFVNCEERDVRLPQAFPEPIVIEPLGRDVEKVEPARVDLLGDLARFERRRRRVKRRGVDSVLLRGIDLIFHEREQGTDDDAQTRHEERGKLVAQRFAAPCRHNGEDVASCENCADDRLLMRAKRGISEDVGERAVERIVFFRGFSRRRGVCGRHAGQSPNLRVTRRIIPNFAFASRLFEGRLDGRGAFQ